LSDRSLPARSKKAGFPKTLDPGAHQLRVALTKSDRTARELCGTAMVKVSVKDSNWCHRVRR
jgi:hypothetical protein